MDSKKFYISDLHLGHKNIIKHEERPFKDLTAMEEAIIEGWNSVVGKDDTVYILGDLSFEKPDKIYETLKQLNGKKCLIMGNHDSRALTNFKDQLLYVRDISSHKDEGRIVVMCHYPMAVWEHKHHGAYHLYGHIHSNRLDHHPMEFDLGDHAFNVSADVINFIPRTLDELIEADALQRKIMKSEICRDEYTTLGDDTFDKYGRD